MSIRLHFHALSGHVHRAGLMLSLLGQPYQRVTVDMMAGEYLQPAFPALNAFGQVPVLEDGETVIADSNAAQLRRSYSAHAPEGGVSLATYPLLRAWLSRIESLPGFVGMKRLPWPEPLVAPHPGEPS